MPDLIQAIQDIDLLSVNPRWRSDDHKAVWTNARDRLKAAAHAKPEQSVRDVIDTCDYILSVYDTANHERYVDACTKLYKQCDKAIEILKGETP